MALSPVAQGQPHVASHNAERDAINVIETSVATKASTSHVHTQANVTGLVASLENKADDVHTHTSTQITGAVTLDQMAVGSTITVDKAKNGGTWPARPTSRTDLCVVWTGNTDPGAAALEGDKWDVVA